MRSIVSRAIVVSALLTCAPATALGQSAPPKPLPPIVVDIRGAHASMGHDATTAEDLGVAEDRLPGGGFAFSAGVHVYPFRRRGFALGVGAETIIGHAHSNGGVDANGVPIPELTRRLTGVAGIVSLNFGGRDGWSYLSGGAGPLRFDTTSSLVPHGTAPTTMTPNAGGGIRWFVRPHMAVGFDVRAYLTHPQATTAESAGRDRARVMVFAVGITLR